MKIAIGCDHAGIYLKPALIAYLEKNGYEFTDFGTYTAESCNYADYGAKVAEAVAFGERVIGSGVMIDSVEAFLTTEFEGGRHLARIAKISEIEKKYSK